MFLNGNDREQCPRDFTKLLWREEIKKTKISTLSREKVPIKSCGFLKTIFHFTQTSFENVTQEKIHNPSYSRRSP